MQIPTELEKLFVVIEHDLPDRQQLQKIADGIATEQGEMPKGDDLQRLLDAAAGLTRYEAEGAFSLSLVRHEPKLHARDGLGTEGRHAQEVGPADAPPRHREVRRPGRTRRPQEFLHPAPSAPAGERAAARPRGILLLSPPGCGKSRILQGTGQ